MVAFVNKIVGNIQMLPAPNSPIAAAQQSYMHVTGLDIYIT
jgi:hypothetical protein